jgi:hypothetical protein
MQFNKFLYERPNIKKGEESFVKVFADFSAAKSASEQIKIIDKINRLLFLYPINFPAESFLYKRERIMSFVI